MKTRSMLVGLLLGVAALVGGCTSAIPPLVRSDISWEKRAADGTRIRVRARDPKERSVGEFVVNPETGMLRISNYISSASVDALRAREAEAVQQRIAAEAGIERFGGLLQRAMDTMATRSGLNPPAYQTGGAVGVATPSLGSLPPQARPPVIEGGGRFGEYRELLLLTNSMPAVQAWLEQASIVDRGSTNQPRVMIGGAMEGGYRQYWVR